MRLLIPSMVLAGGLLALTYFKPVPREITEKPSRLSSVPQVATAASRPGTASGATVPHSEDVVSRGIVFETPYVGSQVEVDDSMSDSEEDEDSSIEVATIPAILDELLAKNDPKAEARRYRLMELWGKSHPEALAKWAAQLNETSGRGRILGQSLLIWANTDLEAAIAFAHAEQIQATRDDLLLQLAHESLHQDARKGLELASELPITAERDELLERGVMEWASTDSSQAIRWVREVGDTGLREKLMAAAAIGMAENQSFAAATLAADSLQASPERDRAVVSILQRWVQSEPAMALEWLNHFPEGDLKRSAARDTVATWQAKDPEAARAWVDALPSSLLKESASLALHP